MVHNQRSRREFAFAKVIRLALGAGIRTMLIGEVDDRGTVRFSAPPTRARCRRPKPLPYVGCSTMLTTDRR